MNDNQTKPAAPDNAYFVVDSALLLAFQTYVQGSTGPVKDAVSILQVLSGLKPLDADAVRALTIAAKTRAQSQAVTGSEADQA